ncbi:MAG: dihydroorotate dehydrogenase PyrD [Sulfolobales archaeon]
MRRLGRLSTSVAGLELEHPVMNASGILGSEPEHLDILARLGVSALVSKTITPKPRAGYEPPIVVELRNGGLLNAVGLANPGKEIIPSLVKRARELNKIIIISVGGVSEREFAEVAEMADESRADGIELNLSCPHTRGYGIDIGSDPEDVARVVETVVSVTKIPVIVKLGLSDRILRSAEKALEKGARALALINTVKALSIDVYSRKPILTNVFGGLSGPPIHPIAVRVVYEIYKELRPEIIGCGGVSSWADAAELILAGARAVQIGTALIKNQSIVREVVEGLERWLEEIDARDLGEVVGSAVET